MDNATNGDFAIEPAHIHRFSRDRGSNYSYMFHEPHW